MHAPIHSNELFHLSPKLKLTAQMYKVIVFTEHRGKILSQKALKRIKTIGLV